MNIQYPPKEPCGRVWPVFVEWMGVKMSQDAMYWSDPGGDDIPIHNITFRQHEFLACPFCGVALDPKVPIAVRHPK
jgi:hypothetical protein